jgi:23S rRNA U2552 (ribose-2'-O)-methylase RlmE/FtsJ
MTEEQAVNKRMRIFKGALLNLPPGRIVDLGAGHCIFSQMAHDAGRGITAVDARNVRVPEGIQFPFIHSDVRDIDLGPWDIVLILGLFYHMTIIDQERLLSKCKGKTLIVDTHTSPTADVKDESYEGRYYNDYSGEPTSAWGNEVSFWHTEKSLMQIFADYGFSATKLSKNHAPGRAFWRMDPVQ